MESHDQAKIDHEHAEDLERGRWLFAQASLFVKGVVGLDGLPEADRPEIAFVGRSNVGKSSLINTLTNQKTLARTSNTPGRTRELNYFTLTDGLYLVDLPGYGYARVERALVEKWTALLKDYLMGRASLRRAFILVDARHGLKPLDVEMMDMFDVAGVSYQVILTKADKVKKTPLDAVRDKTQEQLAKRPAAHPVIVVTSAEKGTGIPELRAAMSALADWDLIPYKPSARDKDKS